MSNYKAEMVSIETTDHKLSIQVRIDHVTNGYYIIEINPETKIACIIKDRMKDNLTNLTNE